MTSLREIMEEIQTALIAAGSERVVLTPRPDEPPEVLDPPFIGISPGAREPIIEFQGGSSMQRGRISVSYYVSSIKDTVSDALLTTNGLLDKPDELAQTIVASRSNMQLSDILEITDPQRTAPGRRPLLYVTVRAQVIWRMI